MLKTFKNLHPARFFEYLEKFYILLIISYLSLMQKFRFFAIDKKSLQVLNFHFERKYHFVKLKNCILACFRLFLAEVFDRLFMRLVDDLWVYSQTPIVLLSKCLLQTPPHTNAPVKKESVEKLTNTLT